MISNAHHLSRVVALCVVLGVFGCGNGGEAPQDAPPADADATDAGDPDVPSRCPSGQQFVTGDYVDWDSTDENFLGIFMAVFTDEEAPANTASTAPNGRVELCVGDAAARDLTVEHPDYLPALMRVDRAANAAGAFGFRGLSTTREPLLFTDELSLVRDPNAAQVIVAVRGFPEGAPVIGAQVALAAANDGAFTADTDGRYGPGATTTDDAFVLFANVPVGNDVDVTVTPPGGTSCVGPTSAPLRQGSLTLVAFACSAQ